MVMITARRQGKLKRMPTPPAMKPKPARTKNKLTRNMAAPSSNKREKAQEFAGQVMPGLSSKYRIVCPKYSKWTSPCRIMNMPKMMLIGTSLWYVGLPDAEKRNIYINRFYNNSDFVIAS